ncbi:MAG: hypothetical protein M3Z32_13630 [Acidobacteriota bacterium]|nr:hypothetical protein [Acidobacteriota bacterium]
MKELLFVSACSLALFAQSVTTPVIQDVLNKAREALGGESKLKAVKSIVATGTYHRAQTLAMAHGDSISADQPEVRSGDMEVSFLLPDKFLKEETMALPNGMAGPALLEGLDGETAWNDTRQTAGMMVRIKIDSDDASRTAGAKLNFARYTLAMLLAAPDSLPLQFTYAGEAEAPDGKADVVDVQGDKFAAKLFIDKNTHMPLMIGYRTAQVTRVMNMQHGAGSLDVQKLKDPKAAQDLIDKLPKPERKEVDVQLHMSDYRKVGAILLPHLLTWTSNGATTDEFEIKKYAVNGKLNPDHFRKP